MPQVTQSELKAPKDMPAKDTGGEGQESTQLEKTSVLKKENETAGKAFMA